jgi:hypothetical protein
METLFFHGKTTDGRRFTIAGKFTQKGKIIIHNLLLLGASLCSKNDCFIKKVGRYKAEGRMMSGHRKGRIVHALPKEPILTERTQTFIEAVASFNTLTSEELQKYFGLYHYEK